MGRRAHHLGNHVRGPIRVKRRESVILVSMSISSTGARRQERALRNDEVILDSGLELADEAGWAGLLIAPVTKRAGLSWMTVKARFADRSELGAAVWERRISSRFADAVRKVLAVATAPGEQADPAAIRDALKPFIEPDQAMRAGIELVLVARYDEAVGPAVQQTLEPLLEEWLVPSDGEVSRVQAARRAYLLQLALGLLSHSRSVAMVTDDLGDEYSRLAKALSVDVVATPLPSNSADHIDRPVDFGTGDPAWEALLLATIDEVGRLGYEAATVEVITKASGYTRGLLFGRYESKQELFLDATRRMAAAAVDANFRFVTSVAEEFGQGVADAVLAREFALPHRKQARTVTTEQYRIGWHDDELLAAVAAAFAETTFQFAEALPDASPEELRAQTHLELALGQGIMIAADLHPVIHRLQLDVVMTPMADLLVGGDAATSS